MIWLKFHSSDFIFEISINTSYQRYRIFLFPGKSLTFAIFGQKSSEWVKNVYFFFPLLYFFFSAPWEWVSEWNVNFSWEKKNTKKCWKKKIHDQNSIMFENCLIYLFLTFFCRYYFFFEWVAFKLFLGKKNTTLFFLAEKKIQNSLKSSEWVGYKLFRGKKKYDTFD